MKKVTKKLAKSDMASHIAEAIQECLVQNSEFMKSSGMENLDVLECVIMGALAHPTGCDGTNKEFMNYYLDTANHLVEELRKNLDQFDYRKGE